MNLNQVTIPVRDVATSISFYEQLGLQVIVKSLPGYARFVCPDGTTTFSVHEDNAYARDSGVWIYFEVEELDQYVHNLVSRGIAFEELPVDKPWLWRESRLRDPDNHIIIIYFAGSNRLDPPWRLP